MVLTKIPQIQLISHASKFAKMGNKKYYHPLTIADSRSRFVFAAKAHYKEDYKFTETEFTRLSYWFIGLGIMQVFSDSAHREQNGRHERMHRDLKAACALPSAYDMKSQQRKLNSFVKEYNQVRPHEALDMETPAKVHQQSKKIFPERIRNYDYPSQMKVMSVCNNASVRWKL